ncbi:hypothetical protein LTR78_008390 [Recurvomyces mirabilis]|uniref:Uncharacterized protein n=1 Tax=Recurvomyces mirabilis TaxID=574656 RepID=A0AAE0WIT6_9PEZI|nr:hypothetical protein LTR78_008390 [Recurvomyces mirabilis]KAK5155377.1 hypothetical protein LTS14_005638 [Recurvomyces mirabilis]
MTNSLEPPSLTMDPRIRGRNPDYGKRPASRSPEGGVSRKLSKTSPREGSSTPNALDAATSRRSSVSTTTAAGRPMQPPNGSGFRGVSQRPNAQKETGSNYVASPDSLGSKRSRPDEVHSGQSTPRSANGTTTTRQDSTLAINNTPLESGPDHFMKCMIQNTEFSKLSNARDQAEARVKKAQNDYQSMSKHFNGFPVIKEQKAQALADARTALETTKRAFEKQHSILRQLSDGVGKFPKSTEVNPPRDSSGETITVTIEDFRKLCERISKLESEAADASADSRTRDRVSTLEVKLKAGPHREEMAKLRSEHDSLRSKVEASQVEMQQLKSETKAGSEASLTALQTVKPLALKVSSDLGQISAMQREINNLKRTAVELSKDVQSGRNTSQISGRAVSREDNDAKQSVERLSRDVSSFGQQLTELKTGHDILRRHVLPMDDAARFAKDDQSISGKLSVAIEDIAALFGLMEATVGEGEVPVGKRLLELERLADQFSTRLDQVQSDEEKTTKEIRGLGATSSARSDTDTAATTISDTVPEANRSSKTMLEPIEVEVKQLKTEVEQLRADNAHREQMKEQDDEVIINHVFDTSERQLAEQKQWVESELTTLRGQNTRNRESDYKQITASLTELARSTSDTFKAIKSDAEDMKKNHAELNQQIGDLELVRGNISDNRRQIGELATDLANKVDRTQFISSQDTFNKGLEGILKTLTEQQASISASTARQQPPRLPNGTSPAASNGFQPPAMRSPQVNGIPRTNAVGAPSGNPSTDQKLQEMSQKVEALTYAFQMFQRQYNNITSDDMAARMLEQFGDVWPHAKNYNSAIADLNRLVAQTSVAVERAQAEAREAGRGAAETKTALGVVEVDVKGLKSEVGGLRGRIAVQEGEREAVKEFLEGGRK